MSTNTPPLQRNRDEARQQHRDRQRKDSAQPISEHTHIKQSPVDPITSRELKHCEVRNNKIHRMKKEEELKKLDKEKRSDHRPHTAM